MIAVPVRVRDDLWRFNCKPGHNGLNSTDQLTLASNRPGIRSVIANSDYTAGPIVNEPYRYTWLWMYLRVHALIPIPSEAVAGLGSLDWRRWWQQPALVFIQHQSEARGPFKCH